MPDPAVAAVETLGVDAIKVAHRPRKIPLPGLEQEMVVIVHQTVGVQSRVEARDDPLQHAQEAQPVLVAESGLRLALAVRDMAAASRVTNDEQQRAMATNRAT